MMSVYGMESSDKIFSDSYLELTAKLVTKKKRACSLEAMRGKVVLPWKAFPQQSFLKEQS